MAELPYSQATGIPRLGVFRPRRASTLRLVVLSDKLQAWSTHWADGREQVCRRELDQPCRLCAAGSSARVSVYALALKLQTRAVGIVHVTAGAFRGCPDLQRHAENARGLIVELTRGDGDWAGVFATVARERYTADTPAVGDWLRPALLRLWQVKPEPADDGAELGQLVPLPDVEPAPTPTPAPTPAAAVPSAPTPQQNGHGPILLGKLFKRGGPYDAGR